MPHTSGRVKLTSIFNTHGHPEWNYCSTFHSVPLFCCATSARLIVTVECVGKSFLFASRGIHCMASTLCLFMLVSMDTQVASGLGLF